MNSYSGFIYLHRKLLDNPVTRKPNYLAVWTYLLLNANHKDAEIIWNNENVKINRGQFIGSIQKISNYFNLSTGTITNILKYLEKQGMIKRASNKRFTLFTVCNYNEYQNYSKPEHEVEHPENPETPYPQRELEETENEVENETENKLKTNYNQIETNNNDNNDKTDNNLIKDTAKNSFSQTDYFIKQAELIKSIDIDEREENFDAEVFKTLYGEYDWAFNRAFIEFYKTKSNEDSEIMKFEAIKIKEGRFDIEQRAKEFNKQRKAV